MVRSIRDLGVTAADFLPSVLKSFLDEEGAREAAKALKWALSGSEALPYELWTRFREETGVALINCYGPTEAAVQATMWTGEGEPTGKASPIGRPIANTRLHIVSRSLGEVAPGAVGEICLGGEGVARGYLGRPDLTAACFVPDPWAPAPGGRLYRTGDLGRFLKDGNVEYLGRLDDQVKIRGFRVEPGETEAVLADHPAVREAVVLARDDGFAGHRLVAYYVPAAPSVDGSGTTRPKSGAAPGAAPGVAEIRSYLASRLPEYMLPSAIVALDAIPRTPGGKVDRPSLPSPDRASLNLRSDFIAPRTPVEEVLASIWAELLGVGSVGVRDSFFELGGHSLLATRVMSRVRRAFSVELPLREIFSSPTVEGLARKVEAARRVGFSPAPPLLPIPRDGPLPLSFAQQRLWFLNLFEPESPVYNVPTAFRLRGPLAEETLERALGELVRRHEVLRTTFPAVGGKPTQVIAPPPPPGSRATVAHVDMSTLGDYLDEAARAAELRRLAKEEASRPFDLARGPLVRFTLIHLDEGDHALLITVHHIVADGWSLGLLCRELGLIYGAEKSGLPSPLPEPTVQYADFAAWQRQWLEGKTLDDQLAWWKGCLGTDLPVLELPLDKPRPPVQSTRGAVHLFEFRPDLTAAVRDLSRSEGLSVFMTLLGAFAIVLSRYTGQTDVTVGTPIANRNRAETEGLVGFFVNTLALRVDLGGSPSYRDVLGRVRDVTLGAYDHQDVPFEVLVEALRPSRELGRSPLVQVLFSVNNVPGGGLELPGLTVEPLPADTDTAKFDLSVIMVESGERLAGGVEYSTDLFDEETISRLAGHFERLVRSAVSAPNSPISALPMLSADERREIEEWNATAADYPADRPVHHLFEEHARTSPNAPAVHFRDETLTYGELDRRAEVLAERLSGMGVGPDEPVAICLERSPEMFVAIIGVLKAGGAYLPLDPDHPPERLGYMLEDSGARVLLTQARLVDRLPKPGPGLSVVLVDEPGESAASGVGGGPAGGDAGSRPADGGGSRPAAGGGGSRPAGVAAAAAVPGRGAPEPVVPGRGAPEPVVPGRAVDPSNLAYVIYTSGSTGRPKGVEVEHRSLLNLVFWHRRLFAVTPADRASQVAGPGFDASVWEIWPYLTAGAAVDIMDDETRASPRRVRDFLLSRNITVAFLPTPLAEMVIRLDFPDTAKLRLLLTGGDRLHVFAPRGLPFVLVNNYGPTENTVCATSGAVPEADGQASPLPSIGRPIDNNSAWVVLGGFELAPPGVVGELYIGGASLARGYRGRPDLTAERFVPDPWGKVPGARLYRTGDLVRLRKNGQIDFLGRTDHQVKVRGYRIELGEIEAALGQYPGVAEAAVLADRDEAGDTRLVAYVGTGGAAADQDVSAAAIKAFLAAKLPSAMIPSAVVVLDALPVTSSGKVDRRALEALGGRALPGGEGSGPEAGGVARSAAAPVAAGCDPGVGAPPARGPSGAAPGGEMERLVASIWREVLHLDAVGLEENFFDLGGHSLRLAEVQARLEEALGREVPIVELFRNTTVSSLAAYLAGLGSGPAEPARPARARDRGQLAERQRIHRRELRRGR